MARFWVEFVNQGMVEAAQTVDAPTPLLAARKSVNGSVTLRQAESWWIKVTPVRKSMAYGFVRAKT
jgi:hypothetical protein